MKLRGLLLVIHELDHEDAGDGKDGADRDQVARDLAEPGPGND